MSNEIVVLHKKAETLMDTIYPTLRNYPKFEHGRLATLILKDCSSIISIIGLAEQVKFRRKQRLQEAQSTVFHLKTLLNLSSSQHYISAGFHENIIRDTEHLNNSIVDVLIKLPER